MWSPPLAGGDAEIALGSTGMSAGGEQLLGLMSSEVDPAQRFAMPERRNKSSNEFLLPTPRVTYPLLADLRSGRYDLSTRRFEPCYRVTGGAVMVRPGIAAKTIGRHLVLHEYEAHVAKHRLATDVPKYQRKWLINHATMNDFGPSYVGLSDAAMAAAAEKGGEVLVKLGSREYPIARG
jgi:hypothetical protein